MGLRCGGGRIAHIFHTGDKRFSYSNPFRLASVAKTFKRLQCVAAHFGGYSEWESINCYKDLPNVYFDTCSSLEFISKEMALEYINALGEDSLCSEPISRCGGTIKSWTSL
jgi:predicted TIM-barrel fold metal-dependent hydrolase